MNVAITRVDEDDLADLLPLMRGYSDFYEVDPSDEALLALSRALIADPDREGLQFIARDSEDGTPLGFATVYWMWSTSRAARIGVMNDLFTAPEARRRGVGEALIDACLSVVRDRGAALLQWQTATDNNTAQALYERVGGIREQWYDYYLEVLTGAGYPEAVAGYPEKVQSRPRKVHIVTYKCEQCGVTLTSEVGVHSHGMCSTCGALMKIDDLFSDRRVVSLPVRLDRRDARTGEAA